MNVKQLKDESGNAIQPNSPDKVGFFGTTYSGLSWSVENDITEDGWVRITGKMIGDGTSANTINIKINGQLVSWWFVISSGTSIKSSQLIPVKKGDKLQCTGGTDEQSIRFYPNRTNLENGGGV